MEKVLLLQKGIQSKLISYNKEIQTVGVDSLRRMDAEKFVVIIPSACFEKGNGLDSLIEDIVQRMVKIGSTVLYNLNVTCNGDFTLVFFLPRDKYPRL